MTIRTKARKRTPRPDMSFAPVKLRTRHDGWTPERQIGFIEALSQSGCVAEAARATGMGVESAYRLRARPEAQAFRFAWDLALDYAIRRLSDEVFSRALHGTRVPHFYKGEEVGEHRRFDSSLTMFLLRYRDPVRYARSRDKLEYDQHPDGPAMVLANVLAAVEDEANGQDARIFRDFVMPDMPPDPDAEVHGSGGDGC